MTNYYLIIAELILTVTLLYYFWKRHTKTTSLAKRIDALEVQSVVCDTNVQILDKSFNEFKELTTRQLTSIEIGIETLLKRTNTK